MRRSCDTGTFNGRLKINEEPRPEEELRILGEEPRRAKQQVMVLPQEIIHIGRLFSFIHLDIHPQNVRPNN